TRETKPEGCTRAPDCNTRTPPESARIAADQNQIQTSKTPPAKAPPHKSDAPPDTPANPHTTSPPDPPPSTPPIPSPQKTPPPSASRDRRDSRHPGWKIPRQKSFWDKSTREPSGRLRWCRRAP